MIRSYFKPYYRNIFQKSYNMNIESSEFEHGRVYFKQFGAERVKLNIEQNRKYLYN